MVRAWTVLAVAAVSASCFDFGADLAKCRAEGRCAASDDGGATPEDHGGFAVIRPAGGLCMDGLCWENPFPLGVPITALHAPAPGELYVGGSSGHLLHLKGRSAELILLGRPVPPNTTWGRVTSLATCSAGLSAGLNSGEFFTVSDGGASASPGSFSGFAPSTFAQAWSGPGPSCVLVGARGAGAWVADDRLGRFVVKTPADYPPFGRRMVGLGGSSYDDLFFVSSDSVMVRDADGGLVPEPSPDGGLGATGICSLGAGDAYVSSTRGIRSRTASYGTIGDPVPLNAIACLASNVVGVGQDVVIRCARTGECQTQMEPGSWQVAAAVDDRVALGSRSGELALLGPTGLSRLSSGPRVVLNDVSVGPNGDVWAAGAEGTLLHRTDGGWVAVDAGVGDELFAVAALADGRLVVGGRGGVLRVFLPDGRVDKPRLYDGTTLIQNQMLGQDIRRIRQGPQNVWAVGTGGVILREESDGSWRKVANPGGSNWLDLQFGSAGALWVTGSGAAVVELQPGGAFRLIRGPFVSYSFLTVFVDRDGRAWFAGRESLGMRLNTDGGQEPFTFPGSPDQIVGFLEQPDALYAVGQRSLYRFAGEPLQWEILGPLPLDPIDNAIQAVVPAGEDFFVVGRSGVILRVNRARWLRSP